MLIQIKDIDFVSKEVSYHGIYRVSYQKRASEKQRKQDVASKKTKWHRIREAHDTAFKELCEFIEESILAKNEVHLMKDLHTQYMSLLSELIHDDDQKMMKTKRYTLLNTFKINFLCILKIRLRKTKVIHSHLYKLSNKVHNLRMSMLNFSYYYVLV